MHCPSTNPTFCSMTSCHQGTVLIRAIHRIFPPWCHQFIFYMMFKEEFLHPMANAKTHAELTNCSWLTLQSDGERCPSNAQGRRRAEEQEDIQPDCCGAPVQNNQPCREPMKQCKNLRNNPRNIFKFGGRF